MVFSPTGWDRFSVASIQTGDGTFVFVTDDRGLHDAGYWFPRMLPTTGDAQVVQARVFSAGRQRPFLVMTDETTGMAVLELGTLTRRDDDPNLRGSSQLSMTFSREGFESRFLAIPDDDESVVVRHRFAFTPKNPHGGSKKGRF